MVTGLAFLDALFCLLPFLPFSGKLLGFRIPCLLPYVVLHGFLSASFFAEHQSVLAEIYLHVFSQGVLFGWLYMQDSAGQGSWYLQWNDDSQQYQ